METFSYDDKGPYLPVDPSAVLDYTFEWKDWLNGASIAQHAITVENAQVVSSSIVGTQVVVWLNNFLQGKTATVSCHITDNAVPTAREDTRSLRLMCEAR